MTKTTRQKIYDFNKPTAVYCQIAVSVLAEIYLTDFRFKGIKLKIKSVEAIIENNVSYPLQLLSSKRLQRFIFTTEHRKFEIQLVDENGNLPYIHLSSLTYGVMRLGVKVEDFIVDDIQQIKSDVEFKNIYLAKLFDATIPRRIENGTIHASQITANIGNNIWQQRKIINLK